jgi:hypothetical protein
VFLVPQFGVESLLPFDVREEDAIIQLDVIGNELRFWGWRAGDPMPDQPQFTMTDDTYEFGFVRLASGAIGPTEPSTTTIRFVHISDESIPDVACDIDGDAFCDYHDLDEMFLAGDISSGVATPPAWPVMDVETDGVVDDADVTKWLEMAATHNGFAAPYQRGDASLDGMVNAEDLNALALNWRSADAVWSTGDFTGDGVVDASDLNWIGIHWQKPLPIASAVENLPEPSSGMLFFIAWAIGACRFRGTRKLQGHSAWPVEQVALTR